MKGPREVENLLGKASFNADQWFLCLNCRKPGCPSERVMEYKMNPKDFTCNLWEEDGKCQERN